VLRDERIRRPAQQVAATKMVPRPLLANVDLGVVSFRKDMNVLDPGELGSVVLAHDKDVNVRQTYVLRVLQPDFIELHGGWLDFLGWLKNDPQLDAIYKA
jgi:hypothetical protein